MYFETKAWKLNMFNVINKIHVISFCCNTLDLLPPKPKFTLDT